MKRKFDDLRANLEEFIEQTDYSLLIVSCVDAECPYVSQFLAGFDLAHPDKLFFVHIGPFDSPGQYLDELSGRMQAELEQASEERVERGAAPYPAMPAGVTDPHLDPVDRFELWLRFLPSLLDDAASQSFVVGLLPIECSDDAGYARLIARVVPHPERPPWMEPLRLVAFDNRQSPQLSALLEQQKVTHVLTASIDFSTPAITDALAREAVDPSVPQPQRLASLLQLAAIDFSYQRHDEAQRKYAMLFDAYSDPPDYVAQALCLQGTGDSQAATGELEKAKATLERGLALCVEHEQKVPMLQLLLSMIRLCFTLRHHEDAETYAHSGMILSAGAMNLPLCATLAEQKGDAQLAQEKRADAVASYLHARTLAEGIDLFPVWTSVLTKLIEHYAATGEHSRADELSDELRRVQAAERGLGPSPSLTGPAPANAESPA